MLVCACDLTIATDDFPSETSHVFLPTLFMGWRSTAFMGERITVFMGCMFSSDRGRDCFLSTASTGRLASPQSRFIQVPLNVGAGLMLDDG
jgi:hypothetical protein